jgi:hypothetical protein
MHMLKLNDQGAIARYPYQLGDLMADHPNTSFALPLVPADLTDFGVHAVAEVPAPSATIEQIVAEAAPTLIDGVWAQQWAVTNATPEQIAARRAALVPSAVTMRQARLALHGAGKLAAVEAAINALSEPARTAARIEWDYSGEVQRHHGLVASLAPALGLSAAQVDALFIDAGAL